MPAGIGSEAALTAIGHGCACLSLCTYTTGVVKFTSGGLLSYRVRARLRGDEIGLQKTNSDEVGLLMRSFGGASLAIC